MAEQTITINGFSKAYSMPGWRLGYLAAPMWLAKRIAAFQSHTTSNPTSFAQYGAIAALTGPQEPVENMRKAFAARRDLVYDLVSAIPGIKTIRPQGAFYLFFNVASFGLGGTDFVTRLLDEQKVAAVPGDAFGDSESVRISYACSDAVIREACSRLKDFCAGLK
jgi:aspartate aminotransferase